MGFGLHGPLGAQTCVFKSGDRRLRIVLGDVVPTHAGDGGALRHPWATKRAAPAAKDDAAGQAHLAMVERLAKNAWLR